MGLSRWLRNQWDRAAAILSAFVGGVSLLVGWLGVSRVSLPAEQIPYLASGAMFGLFALGIGATLWLSADLRDEWRKLDEIHRSLQPEETRTVDLEERATAQEQGSRRPNAQARLEPARASPTIPRAISPS